MELRSGPKETEKKSADHALQAALRRIRLPPGFQWHSVPDAINGKPNRRRIVFPEAPRAMQELQDDSPVGRAYLKDGHGNWEPLLFTAGEAADETKIRAVVQHGRKRLIEAVAGPDAKHISRPPRRVART